MQPHLPAPTMSRAYAPDVLHGIGLYGILWAQCIGKIQWPGVRAKRASVNTAAPAKGSKRNR